MRLVGNVSTHQLGEIFCVYAKVCSRLGSGKTLVDWFYTLRVRKLGEYKGKDPYK